MVSNDASKGSHVCKGTKDNVTITGTVAEKDGKQMLTATKVDGGGEGGHKHGG